MLTLGKWAFAHTSSYNEYLKYANPFHENPICQLIANGHPKPYTKQFKAWVQKNSFWHNGSGCIPWFSVHGASMAACWRLWLWCEPQHDLGTINHMRTTGLVEPLDSLLMVHTWQHAQGFGFGVYLNTILEQSTTRVQRVRLNFLILCWWCIYY